MNTPESVQIAEVRKILNDIVNHPALSPDVIELLLKSAHLVASINADKALRKDIEELTSKTKEESEGKENE